MQLLYSTGFSQQQRDQFRAVIRQNVVQSLMAIVNGTRKLKFEFGSEAAQLAAQSVANIEQVDFWVCSINAIKTLELMLPSFSLMCLNVELSHCVDTISMTQSNEIGQIVKVLWGTPSAPGDESIRKAFASRHKFQLDDSCA
jgi:hypothetical protein